MMTSARIRLSGLVVVLSLAVSACGTESPKMQIPNTKPSVRGQTTPTANQPVVGKGQAGSTENPKLAVDPGRITKANYDKITIGMAEKDVRDLLGPPSSEKPTNDGPGRTLIWQTGKKLITATFRDDRLKWIEGNPEADQ